MSLTPEQIEGEGALPTARFEVHFRPSKRKVRGVHQPDVSYNLPAATAAQATAEAKRNVAIQHPGYLYVRTVAV